MGRRLYVGNFAFDTTVRSLKHLFAQAGARIGSVMIDRATGQSRRFGFVEMSSNAEAQQAILHFNGYELDGRALKLNEARDRHLGEDGGRS